MATDKHFHVRFPNKIFIFLFKVHCNAYFTYTVSNVSCDGFGRELTQANIANNAD